jgi:hypothetical protein
LSERRGMKLVHCQKQALFLSTGPRKTCNQGVPSELIISYS